MKNPALNTATFRRTLLLGACMLALLASCRLKATVTLPLEPQDRHQVFVWYMVCYSETVDFYKQEIELAQRHGIDGFLLDCGEWRSTDANGKKQLTRYVTNAENIFQAAEELAQRVQAGHVAGRRRGFR